MAEQAFEARKAELKEDGQAGRWFTPLKLHVLPRLGKTPVEEIDQNDIKLTLAPIWHTKADTAQKAMQRLGIVLTYAAAMGLDVDLQATDKAKALDAANEPAGLDIDAMMGTYFGGDMESGFAMSGQVQGRIHSVEPVADILQRAWADCQSVLRTLGTAAADASISK